MRPFEETRSEVIVLADPTGTIDAAPAINAAARQALRVNKRLVLPAGDFLCNSQINIPRESNDVRPELIVEGAGEEDTRLHIMHPETGVMVGGSPGGAIQSGYFHLRDLSIIGNPETRPACGIALFQLAWFSIERVKVSNFTYFLWGIGVLTGSVSRCVVREVTIGAHLDRDATSAPNALTFSENEFGMIDLWAIEAIEAAGLRILGGTVEGCGINNAGWGGGIRLANSGTQGFVGATIDGVWFEANAGLADIYIEHGASDCTYSVHDCTFNRMHADKHTTNCIRVVNGAGVSKLSVYDNGFGAKDGDYVEDATRKYVAIGGAGTGCAFDWASFPQRNLCQSAVAT